MDRYSAWSNAQTYIFFHVEVINDLVEPFQIYSTHIINHTESTAEYRSRQAKSALYYEKVVRKIDIVL